MAGASLSKFGDFQKTTGAAYRTRRKPKKIHKTAVARRRKKRELSGVQTKMGM